MIGLSGKRRIVLLTVLSGMLMSASLTQLAFAQQIEIRQYQIDGKKASVQGSGATPNGLVVASLDNATLGRTVADADGVWQMNFALPDLAPGWYYISFVDNETGSAAQIGFEAPRVEIKIYSVYPSSGTPGTMVFVSGAGATSGGEVRIYFDGTFAANTTADDYGSWTLALGPGVRIPNVAPGNYTITALDVASNTTDSTTFRVTVPPTIHVSPQEAPIGSEVRVTGENFSPGMTYLMFEDLLFFSPVYVDQNGEFNTTLFVPVINSGNYTISAILALIPLSRAANASFRVTIGLESLFTTMADVRNGLNQTQTVAQAASAAATAAKDQAARLESLASEARIYSLAAMVLAMIAAAASIAALMTRRRQT